MTEHDKQESLKSIFNQLTDLKSSLDIDLVNCKDITIKINQEGDFIINDIKYDKLLQLIDLNSLVDIFINRVERKMIKKGLLNKEDLS